MIRHLAEWFSERPLTVSGEWLRDQERKSDRVEFVGPSIQFPIRKLVNESGKWNARRLKRQA